MATTKAKASEKTVKQAKTTAKSGSKKEKLGFQAEVKQLLHLVTHALYSNKEIFMRELISNASDAADKLRFEALSNGALYEDDSDLKIWVDFNEKAKTITIRDNGIGMNREEVISHLGTIAKSGTREFLSTLTGDQSKDSSLIGQFGVGFYSAFIVADKVTLKTRRAGAKPKDGVLWESTGEGDYNVETIDKPQRGTEITLHLKKDEKEFLQQYRLRELITKYSDHIQLPIVMQVEQPVPPLAEDADEKAKKEHAKKKPEIKDEVVNQATALWTLAKKDIKADQYKEFYKHISHDFEDPLTWAHNRVEGKTEYTSLLYIPARAPFDMWNREHQKGLKLYIQRVFIMDDAEQLLPLYLRFVKGVVDSSDLPLNISRELLQSNKVIESLKSGCVKRVLSMLEKMANNDPEQYGKFWEAFGQVMKEGPAEDTANRDRIAKLLRFSTTHDDSDKQTVSLEDYVGRMKKGQDKIYYVTAESFNAAKNSPHLEIFRKQGIEVLLLSDRVDEWLISHLTEFDGKQLQSVAKGELDLDKLADKKDKKTKADKEKQAGEFESVLKQVKEVLGDAVKDVRLTDRLTDSPACIVAGEFDMSIHMQRLMQQAGQAMPGGKPTLELNPEHAIIVRLKAEQDDARFAEWSHVLLDQAVLSEGGKLDNPAEFVKRLNKLLLELAA